ncbi:MAG: hypothetical protein WD847_21240 [Pirellulales bacterium]
MGFKSDREFLRNISIGAIGTRKVAAILNRGSFRIIELERHCTSNKIWATKIKRLRVPDLLCLKSGTRIESRGKSKMEVSMSHAVNNPDRAWDRGLRDSDLIAFIRCWPDGDTWRASERVALFRVGDMRAKAHRARRSRMKSASEGSEIRLTWPATIPRSAGTVTGILSDRIETQLEGGRKQRYRLGRKNSDSLIPHVSVDESFGEGDTVIASVMDSLVSPIAARVVPYDFMADLTSEDSAAVYVAVKALGFLAHFMPASVEALAGVMANYPDDRIRLEAAASLARLGIEEGWAHLAAMSRQKEVPPDYRMETAFILAELPDQRSIDLLAALAANQTNDSELRAASAWGLAAAKADVAQPLALVHDPDELTAVHAIVATSRRIDSSNVHPVLEAISDDGRQSAGIIRAVLASECDFVPTAVAQIRSAVGQRRQWLLYLLAAKGREPCFGIVRQNAPDLLPELEFFWTFHAENWTNRLDVADQIDFLQKQV